MSKPETTRKDTSDEIDLGQVFVLIGNGFRRIFRAFLKVFLYFKRNLFWFLGLGVLGVLTGYLLGQLVKENQKLEVIVRPNIDDANKLYDTRTFLYNAVSEIQAEIKANDTSFFRSLGMDAGKMKGFEIEVNPLTPRNKEIIDSESKTLEMLKNFQESGAITDILLAELENKAKKDQIITFYFKDPETAQDYARKIISYINSNPFYSKLVKLQRENVLERIRRNDSLLIQLDLLINAYTQKMAREQNGSEGRLILENREGLDVPSLFEMKNQLIRDTEYKRMELEMNQEPITIVNFGNAHEDIKPLFSKNYIFFPLLFIGVFLLFTLIRFLNAKAEQKHQE